MLIRKVFFQAYCQTFDILNSKDAKFLKYDNISEELSSMES